MFIVWVCVCALTQVCGLGWDQIRGLISNMTKSILDTHAIWSAIPWSMTVIYFASVGKTLDRLSELWVWNLIVLFFSETSWNIDLSESSKHLYVPDDLRSAQALRTDVQLSPLTRQVTFLGGAADCVVLQCFFAEVLLSSCIFIHQRKHCFSRSKILGSKLKHIQRVVFIVAHCFHDIIHN